MGHILFSTGTNPWTCGNKNAIRHDQLALYNEFVTGICFDQVSKQRKHFKFDSLQIKQEDTSSF